MQSKMQSEKSMGEIVILHVDDGKEWSSFLEFKLNSKDYNIKTVSRDIRTTQLNQLIDATQVQVSLITPELLDETVSSKINFDVIENNGLGFYVLLGVDESDIEIVLGEKGQMILKGKYHLVDQVRTGQSIKEALVKIIETYEMDEYVYPSVEDEDIYDKLPSPRQVNKIFKVIQETDHEVIVVLDRPADGDVTAVFEDDVKSTVVLERMDKTMYKMTVPEYVSGQSQFIVNSQSQEIGKDKVKPNSRLDQLHDLLIDVMDPISLISQALGLGTTSLEDIDEKLAEQLQNQYSLQTLQILGQFESHFSIENKAKSEWPTILHFAAEYNLTRLSTELLKYPGMVTASCTENVHGEYPCMVAQRKGYYQLKQQLIRYMEASKFDSGYVDPTVTDLPPPAPHIKAHFYINKRESTEGEYDPESPYMDMKGIETKLTSCLTDRKRTDESRIMNQPPVACTPWRLRAQEAFIRNRSLSEGAGNLPGMDQACLSSEQPHTQLRPLSESEASDYDTPQFFEEMHSRTQKPNVPKSQNYLHPVYDERVSDVFETVAEEEDNLDVPNPISSIPQDQPALRKNSSKRSRIATFFKKIGLMKTSGDSELMSKMQGDKAGQKTKTYTRQKRGSDPCLANSLGAFSCEYLSKSYNPQRKQSLPATLPSEMRMSKLDSGRDSGSFSEEEEAEKPVVFRKKGKHSSNQGKRPSLERTKSQRVSRALMEDISNAPSVPTKPIGDCHL